MDIFYINMNICLFIEMVLHVKMSMLISATDSVFRVSLPSLPTFMPEARNTGVAHVSAAIPVTQFGGRSLHTAQTQSRYQKALLMIESNIR